jgi:hypothetical protein
MPKEATRIPLAAPLLSAKSIEGPGVIMMR